MARDIVGRFERMVGRARGGRRADVRDGDALSGQGPAESVDDEQGGGSPSSGGFDDRLRDIVRKGRSSASRTTTATRTAGRTARDRIRRTPAKHTPTERASALPPEGVVTVEYSPHIDGDPDPGEVVWTWVPFEDDPDQGKDRPVVVIGRRNRSLVGVPLTTRRNDREAQIAIGTGAWDPERRPSYARIWRMLDIDPDGTRREGAVLERGCFDTVIAAVDEYYDIRRPNPAPDDDGFDHD